MTKYIKNIVINFNEDGTFASATKLVAGVMTADGSEEPQPNVEITLAEIKAALK